MSYISHFGIFPTKFMTSKMKSKSFKRTDT